MDAFFRIAVISAILYLVRFALAHQKRTESSDSAYSLREDSWSTGDGSSETTFIKSEVSLDSDDFIEKDEIKSGTPLDSDDSIEKDQIKSGTPLDKDDSIEKDQVKSGTLLDSDDSIEKDQIKSRIPQDSSESIEKVWVKSGNSVYSGGSSKNYHIKSGIPIDSEGSLEKVVTKSAFPLDSGGSNEKVLIKSGVPLRGRTIHHTAWSEEDKVQESNENLPQQIENGLEKFYDSWSLRNALNYILSFVYDVEDGSVNSNLAPNPTEKPKEQVNLQNNDFDNLMVVPQTQGNPKDEAGNLPIYKRNRDSLLHTTPKYLITNFEKQDYEDNDDELSYEDTDFEYEDEFSDAPEDESAMDRRQSGQLKSKNFKQPEREIQKSSQNEHLYKLLENEPSFEVEHLHQRGRETKEINENIPKKSKEDGIQLDKGTLSDHNLNSKIQKPRKNIKLMKTQTQKHIKEQSKDNENASIYANQDSEVNAVDITTSGDYKTASEKKSIKPKKQDNQIMSLVSGTSTLKSNENHLASKREKEKPLEESGNKVAYKEVEAEMITESKISIEIPKKNNSPPPTVSNDLQNDNNDSASSDKNSLEKTTIKSKPFTLNTSDQKHLQIKEENMVNKDNFPDLSTQGHSQPKDKKSLINAKKPTLARQRHPQPKEQSPESVGNYVQNEKSKILVVENNQGGKHEDIHQQSTTEQYDKVLGYPHSGKKTTTANSIIYTEQTIHQSKIQRKKEAIHLPEKKSPKVHTKQSNLPQHVKIPKKPLMENGTKHSKSKTKRLNEIYIDLEPEENLGSYNYLLDSFEFIRVDENNQNKVKKKKDNSVHVPFKDEKHGAQEKAPPILLEPFKHQSEQEVKDESHEVFGTILEYLYKNSNNSFLLSLKENNSSVS